MERFIFDLQRFDSFYISDEGKITIDTEGFEYDGTFDVEGNNLLNITTSKT